MPAILKQIRRVHELTVDNCVEACREERQTYAALETQICFCSNMLSDLQEDAKCFACSRRPEEICGGFETVAYYPTGVKGKAAMAIFKCFNWIDWNELIKMKQLWDNFNKLKRL